ncbi:MAG TPA: hypothetical protein ENK43_08555 [Planctomycetes bacterium]|nr:hypothetical protein [Planctomycetota bacterium]
MKWCPEFIVWALLALWLTPSCGSDGCWGSDKSKASAEAEKPAAQPAVSEEAESVPAEVVSKPSEKPPTAVSAAKPRQEKPRKPAARTADTPRVQDKSKAKRKPAPKPKPAAKPTPQDEEFALNAFPPTLSDTKQHRKAWRRNDCLRCHETGVGAAPEVRHKGMPDLLKVAKCRSCHVFEPGKKPTERKRPPIDAGFAEFAFPPMIPASAEHRKAWRKDDCLLCHEDGLMGAPKVRHKGLPPLTLKAKCRTCHVQVRVLDSDPKRH